MTQENIFKVKDMVNAGLFSLLILMAIWISAMIGFIPVLMPVVPFICALVSGPIFMLYTTRIHQFGMVLILGIVIGFAFTISGHGIHVTLGIPLLSLLSEYILRKGNYQSINHARWAYTVFGLVGAINMLPIYFSRQAYYDQLIEMGYGAEYGDVLFKVLPTWSFVPIALSAMLGAYLGCSIGIKLLDKHFKKAGMA